jgi:parallel beta-helix repeat protein
MLKRSCVLVLALSLFWGGRVAYGDFYVISGGRGAGTGITSLPYTINAPGFYYLTKNLSHNGTAITVNANDVTIDLMGFSLSGPGSGTNYGIYMNGRSNVEIRNGTIRSFGSDGILEAAQQTAKNHRVLNVRAVGNGGRGIALFGNGYQVKGCTASDNGDDGIFAGRGSVVTGNTAGNNGGDGIYGNGYNLIAWNVSRDNSGNGITAVGGSTVIGNTAFNNVYGVSASSGCTVTGNTAYSNSKNGISVGPGTYVGATVEGNTAYANGEDGISVGASVKVTGNTAFSNQHYGISFAHSCLVDGNVATDNNQSGGYANLGPCTPCTFGTNHAP